MSELITQMCSGYKFYRYLLGTVSAVALISSASSAVADDEDTPTVWIELGGQLERIDSAQIVFAPPFFADAAPEVLAPMIDAQRPNRYSIGGEGTLTISPHDSDWRLSISARYGRSNSARHLHYQTSHTTNQTAFGRAITEYGRPLDRFGDGQAKSTESHTILDFQAGKDVGLGMFGAKGTSVFSGGVRFAQFTSSSDTILHARPIYRSGPFKYHPAPGQYRVNGAYIQNNFASMQAKRSTQAIGPAVSWDASIPIAGNESSMSVALDWGIDGALLFGRQRVRVHHQTSGAYHSGIFSLYNTKSSYHTTPPDRNRTRTVIIPNVGGFAAASFNYLDAKVKFGYRADFFFGASDNGIDIAKRENIGFYGPFATISVGLGG